MLYCLGDTFIEEIYNIKSKLQNLFGDLLLFGFSTDCYTKIELVKISAISSSIGISRCASAYLPCHV